MLSAIVRPRKVNKVYKICLQKHVSTKITYNNDEQRKRMQHNTKKKISEI